MVVRDPPEWETEKEMVMTMAVIESEKGFYLDEFV